MTAVGRASGARNISDVVYPAAATQNDVQYCLKQLNLSNKTVWT